LTNSIISGDKNNLKRIYSVPKKGGRPKNLKIAPKTKAKPISPLKKQKRKKMKIEIQKKTIIRITNKPRRRFKINSDSDKTPIEISSDSNNEVDKEIETEKKTEIKKCQISASGRHLRNTALPVRYRDS